MKFEYAIEMLKQGYAKRVARAGWNGKGMWLALQKGCPDGVPINKNTADATGIPEGTVCRFDPYIIMKTATGSFVPWLASQTDILAEDWSVVTTEDGSGVADVAIPGLGDLGPTLSRVERVRHLLLEGAAFAAEQAVHSMHTTFDVHVHNHAMGWLREAADIYRVCCIEPTVQHQLLPIARPDDEHAKQVRDAAGELLSAVNIAKVEITVSSNQAPSQVARDVAKELGQVTRGHADPPAER